MADPERFVAELLASAGVEAESESVSESFADERIAEKIARFKEPKQREGMEALNTTLRERHGPHGVRLHLVSAVAHLRRIAGETVEERRQEQHARR